MLLEQVHLPAERFPGLLASDLEHGSLYDLLTERYGVRVAKAREFLEPVLLRSREARLLDRKAGSPALLIEGIASTADGTPVEFGRTFVRGDRTRYYVERVVVRPHRGKRQGGGEHRWDRETPRRQVNRKRRRTCNGGSAARASCWRGSRLIASACGSSTATRRPSTGSEPSVDPAAPITSPVSTGAAGDVEIRWYCCLGGGDAPEQVEVEQQVAEAFNAANPGIHLTFEAVPYAGARDALATQIASGNGPDIVGPVGIGGAEAFHGQWLDLQPFIDSAGYDMTQFPESTVELYNVGGEGQVGIPFAVYPSALFYKAGLFEEAGLAEPPHEWGGTYTMPDGKTVPWDYDTASASSACC